MDLRTAIFAKHGTDWLAYVTETVMAHGSVHRNSILIKIQLDATVCRYLFTVKLLYMFRVSQHPSSGVLKTVTAASGTGQNISRATVEGSCCTNIVTSTGGCGYSF